MHTVHEDGARATADGVAKVVAGIPTIGGACAALRSAGWRASIAGNRITIEGDVYAQFIGASEGSDGWVEAGWMVYRIAGTAPVAVVGAEPHLVVTR